MGPNSPKTLGVIIVSFRSHDVIEDCLTSLLASEFERLKIVVVDNASPDNTRAVIRDWAKTAEIEMAEAMPGAEAPTAQVTMITSPVNAGYGGAVNIGLDALAKDSKVDLFWVLNPDCVVSPQTASAFVSHAARSGAFSLMGSRVLYLEGDGIIQSDGGLVNLWTGVCQNRNQGCKATDTPMPDARGLQFISGANVVASREFLDKIGPMKEDYFLYYEEVDWAMRRGDLPLAWCKEAIVHHHGGTTIGTGAHNRAASGFANFFNFRNRMMFVARFNKLGLITAYIFTALKVLQIRLKHSADQARGGWRGLNFMTPPPEIVAAISPKSRDLAFGAKNPDP